MSEDITCVYGKDDPQSQSQDSLPHPSFLIPHTHLVFLRKSLDQRHDRNVSFRGKTTSKHSAAHVQIQNASLNVSLVKTELFRTCLSHWQGVVLCNEAVLLPQTNGGTFTARLSAALFFLPNWFCVQQVSLQLQLESSVTSFLTKCFRKHTGTSKTP